jgi:hypothetical protein
MAGQPSASAASSLLASPTTSIAAPSQISPPSTATTLLPEESLHAVIAPLYTGTCSNKTFRNLLVVIEHLSYLPGILCSLLFSIRCYYLKSSYS